MSVRPMTTGDVGMESERAGPLVGMRVIDLTANMTGPYATAILAEQGAEVIKIEPFGGEVMRRVGSGRDGISGFFATLNRSKRSIVMDLRAPEAVELIAQLVDRSDVLIQNFRPGVIESLGLGPSVMRERKPSLIYASISGFGRIGPLADAPAYDHVVQALSGMAALQRDGRGGPPSLVRHGLVDKTTGLFAAQAITAALLRRAMTGAGGAIEISMLDAALHFLWPDGMMNNTCLDEVTKVSPVSSSFRLSETADGYVAMITITDRQWAGMLQALELDSVVDDAELLTLAGRMRHGGRVMKIVGGCLRRMSTDAVVQKMRAHDVPCMPVLELDQVASHPQVVAAGSLERVDHPVLGRVIHPRPVARFGDETEPDRFPIAHPGGQTDEVLADLGLGTEEISDLRARRVVG